MDAGFALISSRSTFQLSFNDSKKIFLKKEKCFTVRKRFNKYDFITGPILIPISEKEKKNHWTFFSANVNTKEFLYLDPFIASAAAVEDMFNKWKKFAGRYQDLAGEWTVGNIKHSKQNDDKSCGVIVLMLLQALVKKSTSFSFNEQDVAAYRFKLSADFKQNSKNK